MAFGRKNNDDTDGGFDDYAGLTSLADMMNAANAQEEQVAGDSAASTSSFDEMLEQPKKAAHRDVAQEFSQAEAKQPPDPETPPVKEEVPEESLEIAPLDIPGSEPEMPRSEIPQAVIGADSVSSFLSPENSKSSPKPGTVPVEATPGPTPEPVTEPEPTPEPVSPPAWEQPVSTSVPSRGKHSGQSATRDVRTSPYKNVSRSSINEQAVSLVVSVLDYVRGLDVDTLRFIYESVSGKRFEDGTDENRVVATIIHSNVSTLNVLNTILEAWNKEPVDRSFYIIDLDDDVLSKVGKILSATTGATFGKGSRNDYAKQVVNYIAELDGDIVDNVSATKAALSLVHGE